VNAGSVLSIETVPNFILYV